MQVVGGGKTTNASDLTSGTLDAARLPGVLANVDTQAELQAAVGISALDPSEKTSAYTTTTSDNYIRCNHASTPFTITLHAATGSGQQLIIKNIGAATVTVDGNSAETIDGAATITLAQYSSVTLVDAASGAWDIV